METTFMSGKECTLIEKNIFDKMIEDYKFKIRML
jgi:hypothetical protein